jgi:sec-independent protein translocase protein TatC
MNKEKKKPSEMTFLDHLDELRGALWRALVGVFIGAAIGYYFAPILQTWLLIPFEDQTSASLALLAPTEGFVTRLKISLVAGLLGTAPWIFYQIWAFVAPGLFMHERKLVLPVVFFSSLLFLTGSAFSLYVLPHATTFFLSFSTMDVQNAWSLGKYVDFVLRLLLAFGLVFELPLLIYFLARFGVVTPPFLRKYRKHMIIGFLILAALITPPDVFTQAILTVPMVILYEASILLAIVAQKQYERKREEFMSDGGEEDSNTNSDDPTDNSDQPGAPDNGSSESEEMSKPVDSDSEENGVTKPTADDIREERLRIIREEQAAEWKAGLDSDATESDTDADSDSSHGLNPDQES